MNLNAFNLRDLQIFMALTQVAEASGVTDIRFIRATIAAKIEEEAKLHKQKYSVTRDIRKTQKLANVMPQVCPHCGGFVQLSVVDGLTVMTCKKCRWSKLA